MQNKTTTLPNIYIIEPRVFEDQRGFFFESYNKSKFTELGIECDFVQDNHSKSVKGTLRGLHYQLKFPQAKLCRVTQGEILDVAVDIRSGSPTFGKWISVILSAENKKQIFVPRGFAHGFLVLSDTAEFIYKCDEFYHPEDECGIIWNDPSLNINWEITKPVLSSKDQGFPALAAIPKESLPSFA